MVKYGKEIIKCTDFSKYLTSLDAFLANRGKAAHTFISDVEQQITENHKRIHEQVSALESLQASYFRQVEYRAVLRKSKDILGD